MKRKLWFAGIIISAIISLNFIYFSPPSPSSSSTFAIDDNKEFIIGAMGVAIDGSYSHYSSLNLNSWHNYSEPMNGWPGISTDLYTNSTSLYEVPVTSRIKANRSSTNGGMRTIMDRPKIEYLAFGQRSDYQCESAGYLADPAFEFYTYTDHIGADETDNTSFGGGVKVRHCRTTPFSDFEDSPGFVVKGLKSNHEQSNKNWNTWKNDDTYKWYVMPKIRIPTGLSDNTLVCRVQVVDWHGDTTVAQTITARNFRKSGLTYGGQYREDFYFNLGSNADSSVIEVPAGQICPAPDLDFTDWSSGDIKTDYRIYWYGQCDMWIDYVRVENEPAHRLFKGEYDTDIREETVLALTDWGTPDYVPNQFYIEEFEFNILPCAKYVNNIIKHCADSIGGVNLSLMMNLNYPLFKVHLNDCWHRSIYAEQIKKFLIDYVGLRTIVNSSYNLEGWEYSDPHSDILSDNSSSTIPNPNLSLHPNTFPISSYNKNAGILSYSKTVTEYDNWLEDRFDIGGGSQDGFTQIMKMSDTLQTKCPGLRIIHLEQAHSWWHKGHKLKEPSNEELDLMANLSVSYGAKGILYFWYDSFLEYNDPINWGRGITEGHTIGHNLEHRTNVYGQDKFNGVADINARLKKWGPTLMGFNNDSTHSYINKYERANLLSRTYFSDIVTYKTSSTNPSCSEEDTPLENLTVPSGLKYECPEDRYIQASVFKNTNEPYTNYFMIINKRCSPYIDETSADNRGGKRFISIRFDANHPSFSGFNNWNLIDIESGSSVVTFDKRVTSNINLDWFNPGQGKLYKLVPTFMVGGTLVCDENMSGVVFDCNGSVTANNKKITIGGSVNINFKDSTGIFMSGGTFKCGAYTESLAPTKSVNLHSQSGMQWAGLCFNDIDTVIIQNTELKDIKSIPDLNEGYGMELINAKVINIDGSNIYNMNSDAAGIHVYYVTNLYMNPTVNITSNTIKISTDDNDGINITPYSWLTLTGYIYGNKIINTSSGGGRNGIYAFDVVGTPIKNNYIENFAYGTFTWYSSLDIFENTIDTKNISNGWDLYGIVSEYNLSNAYDSRMGGSNVLTTLDGRCVSLDAMDLNISDGNNIFQINDSSGYHLRGYYPTTDLGELNAKNNCFKIGTNSIDESAIRKYVKWSDGTTDVDYAFSSNCPSSPNYCDFYLGGNPNDTVWIQCAGGMGGGQKESMMAPSENIYKQIYDSLSINMRKKQYDLAAQKCITLLDNYTDSARTINVVDKLYYTSLALNKVSELKSYYESLIQNHPNSTQLIQRMFYYIQKAKAKLGQYGSAMTGFQTIMNQFPTSYEGVAARWDYMATQLLDTSSGNGGGEQLLIDNEQLTEEKEHERLVSLVEDPLDKYDRKKFTKEDRKVIVNNIVNAFETQKTKETSKIKELEIKIVKNEANESEKLEYKKKTIIKEVVKPQRVHSINEHISVVQNDIKRIFPASEKKGNVDNVNAIIPLEYKLNQNYPNPFNPSTKISYEIKAQGFVSLKIYDLLGREIAELVNETKEAGRYTLDFNASKYSLSSGIYFYRIKAGEFVETKRMVLIK